MVVVDDVDTLPVIAPSTGWMHRAWHRAWWLYEGVIGIMALVAGLAFIAALPIVQFASFGYLLESAGRIAHEQRLAAGLIGVRAAAKLGTIALCGWLLMLPLRARRDTCSGAQLVDPGGEADAGWSFGLLVLTTLIVVHFCRRSAHGGQLRNFLWPAPLRTLKLGCSFLTGGSAYTVARDAVYDAVVRLRPSYYFWLGLRGFLTGLVWLLIPVSLLAAGRRLPALGFLGGLLLTIVVLYLPFLQTRFAAENRWRAMFEVRAVRRLFIRPPWAFLTAAVGHARAVLAAEPVEDRTGATRGGLATEFDVRGDGDAIAVGYRLGGRPRGTSHVAAVEAFAVVSTCAHVAGRRSLRLDCVFHAIHLVVRHRQSLRAACIHVAGAILGVLRKVVGGWRLNGLFLQTPNTKHETPSLRCRRRLVTYNGLNTRSSHCR